MSIAEKPKSQEVLAAHKLPNHHHNAHPCQMITESEQLNMQEQADNGACWQEYGGNSNQAVCPSNQFLACH